MKRYLSHVLTAITVAALVGAGAWAAQSITVTKATIGALVYDSSGPPAPSSSVRGGVKSLASVSHQFLTSITTAGVPTQAQPACGDLSDASPTCATDGTNASNISSGTLNSARLPAISCSTLSNGAASCSTDTTVASNISSGTLPAGRLPNPSSSSLGGVQSIASASHNFLTSIGTDGVPTKAQPACSDLSNAAASCSTDTTSATNITTGTLPSAQLPTVPVSKGGTNATSAGATAANNIGALAIASNLSDLNSASTARTNLGLGTAATQSTGTFAQVANNLSDVTASTARTNLGLAAVAASGSASDLGSGTLAAARGGAGTVNGALKGNGSGAVSQAACADLSNAAASCATDATNAGNIGSGTLPAARLPNPSATTLGGIQSIASASHNFLTSISTSGVPAKAQPACGDLSDAAASCSTDATAAGNISSGTLPAGRMPALTGDVTTSAGAVATTIAANAVTNAKSAQAAANTMSGNWTGSTANKADNAMPSCSDSGGNHLNYVSGTGVTCGTSDLHAGTVTSVATTAPLAGGTITATGTLSITGAAGQVLAGSTPAFTATPTLGVVTTTMGTLALASSGTGTVTITPQSTAGTPTLTLPNTSGTIADGASSPLVLSATTGNLTCPTCNVSAATVTSVATGTGLSGGTITTSGTIALAVQLTPQGRLTLQSAAPVMTADQTAKGTIYYDSYAGNLVPVYDGTNMVLLAIGSDEISLILDTSSHLLNNLYDVFAYSSSGTLTLGAGPAWVNTATITVTIATPAVVSWTSHGLPEGAPVVFTNSGGALPTGITAGTTYFVSKSPGANSFNISTTVANAAAGTLIATSGSQSGTHTGTNRTTVRGTGAGTTELQRKNGVWTNKNAITLINNSVSSSSIAANQATYLGTFYATANGQTGMAFKPGPGAGGSNNVLGLYNAYNRVPIAGQSSDSTDSWTYNSTTWHAANGNVANRVTYVDGLQQSPVSATHLCTCQGSTVGAVVAVDLDSTATQPNVGAYSGANGVIESIVASEDFAPQLGLHYAQAMEHIHTGSATVTFYGDGGAPTWLQALIVRLAM